jgi:ADP-ribose pyrophosphatase YjhB (NUDIX family)
VIVTRRNGGIVLVKAKGTVMWTLPAARIGMDETPEDAARRVAMERCGLNLIAVDLKAFYDVTRHYQNVSVKRLFVVYCCSTDMDPDGSLATSTDERAIHFDDLDKLALEEIDAQAIADCL